MSGQVLLQSVKASVLSLVMVLFLVGCASQSETGKPADVAGGEPEKTGHAGHHMSHSAERDAQGRQLYDMKHAMSPEVKAELRQREVIPPYVTDAQMDSMMEAMGPNYAWYISDTTLMGDRGVLILAHGFGRHGDQTFRERLQPVGAARPTTFAFGMSMGMSDHIQIAVDNLTAAGAQEIVVVPAASSRYSTLMRQWEYIFELRDEPAYATVPQVETTATVLFGTPMENHPLVGNILVDYAAEISQEPAKEEIIIVAHGPIDADDNREQLQTMEALADALRAEGYADAHPVTLQDDAPKDVRDANVQNMRALVEDIDARGNTVLVVTNLLGTRTVQRSIRRDLKGLGYRYNFKGLVQHEKFVEWVELVADQT